MWLLLLLGFKGPTQETMKLIFCSYKNILTGKFCKLKENSDLTGNTHTPSTGVWVHLFTLLKARNESDVTN